MSEMTDSCIFCQILEKKIDGSFVYEDQFCAAFLDIRPINAGHILIVPKIHRARFTQYDPDTAGYLFKIGNILLRGIERSPIRCEGANLFLSDGEAAGQDVFHCHLHLAPRFKGDGQRIGFIHAMPELYPRKMLDELAGQIIEGMKTP